MFWRYIQSGTDIVRYQDGELTIQKLSTYLYFGRCSLILFSCFPIFALFFLLSGGGLVFHTPDGRIFAGVIMLGAFLMCGLGWLLFLPLAVTYRMTLSLREKRWTLARGFWRWQEKTEGSADDFKSILYTENSEFGNMGWLTWKEKKLGNVSFIVGDKPRVKAKDLAQEISKILEIPLTDHKHRLIAE